MSRTIAGSIFGYSPRWPVELDLIEFADAIDQVGDDLAEHGDDLRLGDGRVFDDVVQDGGDRRIGIEVRVGEMSATATRCVM